MGLLHGWIAREVNEPGGFSLNLQGRFTASCDRWVDLQLGGQSVDGSPSQGNMVVKSWFGGIRLRMGRRMSPAILNGIASKSPLIRYLIIIVGGGLVIMPGTLYVWAGDFYWWSLILTVIGGYILSGPPGDNEDPRE